MTWTEEIVAAMQSLGGAARYRDLYSVIERTTSRKLTAEWQATIRRTIEDHSSDSKNYRSEDVFEHVSHGHWKLRGVAIDDAELAARESLTPDEVMARVFVREHWRDRPSLNEDQVPVAAWCDDTMLRVRLRDGREIATPLWWYPSLRKATHGQRNNLELMSTGVHWPDLNEDLSVSGMLSGWKSPEAHPVELTRQW